jgi:hypothetical protein
VRQYTNLCIKQTNNVRNVIAVFEAQGSDSLRNKPGEKNILQSLALTDFPCDAGSSNETSDFRNSTRLCFFNVAISKYKFSMTLMPPITPDINKIYQQLLPRTT